MKTKKTSGILLLFASAYFLLSFTADDDPLTKFLKSFQQYFTTHTQEKIYLHTDKPYYAVGDQIWFKAYVVDAQNLKSTPNSNILYVDLIDAKDSVQKTLRLPLVAGLGWGNFELKDSIKEGNYRLRAYTTWMRNYDEAFFYDKTFKVGNAWANQLITKATYSFTQEEKSEKINSKINFSNLDGYPYANKEVTYNVVIEGKTITKGKIKTDEKGNIELGFNNTKASFGNSGRINAAIKIGENTTIDKIIPIKSTSNSVDVQFFPEGGNLVQDVRSKVAFKALGADGLGKAIAGYVQDNNGEKLALINTRNLGMGIFSLTPKAGKTYEAVVKFEDGSERNIKLPTVLAEGATLSIMSSQADSITVKVAVNNGFLQQNLNKFFTVVAQNSGNILYTASSKITSLAFSAKLDRSRFISGINQFTLFDENMQPIAERLIFIPPTDTIGLAINTDKTTYTQRSKATLSIKSTGSNGLPVMGAFSIAVVDAGKVNIPNDEEESIFTNLLLTSDIKGYVEKPNYYLSNITESKTIDTDVLMLTQGWRRFNWKNLNVPQKDTFKPEKTLSISGRVTRGKDKPVVDGTVTIFSSGKKPFLVQTKTNALGEFMVDSLYFPDSTRFMVQARNVKDRKFVEIELYNSTFPVVLKNKNQADLTVNINDSMTAYLKNSKSQYEEWLKNGIVNRSILLGEVVVVDKKPEVQETSNLNGSGNADKVLTEKDFGNAFSIEQALQGRIAGLTINDGIAYIRGREAQIIVDGMNMEPESLSDIPIQDVESIEILKSIAYTAIYGGGGAGGVIIINTKRGKPGFVSKVFVPGVVTYQPIGFLKTKEFYVPNYADPKLNASVADLRTTIYWNPNIITDKLGNANVSFYNGDNTGKYRVILEGTDLNGHLARKVINYNVIPKK
ncbi:Plug domain-containing protein [Pedobacter arcticus]|uniref:Plug domain-containing protein n=1 Tax=Pedobacter arcticus TaxID=752140 RepID=UPI0002E4F6CB|nr:Plug domain-containing protein [Pedobacter arcticus]